MAQLGLIFLWSDSGAAPPTGGGGGGFVPGGRQPGHFGPPVPHAPGGDRPPRQRRRKRKAEPDLPAPEYQEPPALVPPEEAARSRALIELVQSLDLPPAELVHLTPEQRMQAVLRARAAAHPSATSQEIDDAIAVLLLSW